MIKSLFVAALLSILIEAQEYELLVYQDSAQCFFDKTIIDSTGGNQGTSSDPCYSNIGTITHVKDAYRDENGKFSFRLTYYIDMVTTDIVIDQNTGPGDIVLIWSQTSWITDSTLEGADLSQIPTQNYDPTDGQYFHGLGLNVGAARASYLDGSPGDVHTNWYNAVVTYLVHGYGIPSFNGASAKSNKLEILVPENECVLHTNEICNYIEWNTDRIDSAHERIDTIHAALNSRIDTLGSTLNGRIDSVESTLGSTLNGRIDTVNGRINTLRDYLQGTDAAHAFNGDIIPDNKSIPGDLFEFSKTELLLLGLNLITIVFGLFICWKGGLFSKNNKRGYAKVRQYYESDAVEKPINA